MVSALHVQHAVVSSRMGRVDWNHYSSIVVDSFDKSLPVWEEWIEIPFAKSPCIPLSSLFPYGKSGLKLSMFLSSFLQKSLFPYGKSGLKCPLWFFWRPVVRSLPVWEEWIEIPSCGITATPILSLPVWEEWIEISIVRTFTNTGHGLFPYGKSGLKSLASGHRGHEFDSLFPYGKSGLKYWMEQRLLRRLGSLPVWEEWIEIAAE